LDVHVLEWGEAEAPPLVMLHGLTGHAHTWDHMAAPMSRRFHIFAPDQRGHGDTGFASSYTTGDFVADLDGLRAVWGLERFILIGLSMGGHNAIGYASRYPERVSHLVVIDIPPKLRRELWLGGPQGEEAQRVAREGHRLLSSVDEAFADARKGNPIAPDATLRYRTEWNLNRTEGGYRLKWDPRVQVLWQPDDLTSALPSLRMPVLLVRGGRTIVLPREAAEAMVKAIPDAKLIEIPDSGHSVPTDRPDELTPPLLEWLARRGA
jgi:pimeloyl-ACP methyl ester carboxylesterase